MPSRRPLLAFAALLLAISVPFAGCLERSPPRVDRDEPVAAPPEDGGGDEAGPESREEAVFVHDHAAFRVYVNGERLPFTDPAFDLSRTGYVRAHLHVTEPHAGETIHIEDRFPRGEPNVTLNEFLASLGMELDDGRLALSRVHGGETLTDNTTHSVKLAIRRDAGTFAPRPSWGEHVLANCDSVLISYGPRSDNLEPQEASIAMPPGGTSGTTCA